jgi:hypothetical protein
MLELFRVVDRRGPPRQGQTLDLEGMQSIRSNRNRHPRVALDIGEFLRVTGNKAVQQKSIIDVADDGRLRPAVRPIGGDRHDAMLIEQVEDGVLQSLLHRAIRQKNVNPIPAPIPAIDMDQMTISSRGA